MKYKAISLFSGAGGMDVGFESAGIHPVLANDINSAACKSYTLNHSAEIIHGDITDFYSDLKCLKGLDFIFGGPPCQGFSVAGKMNPNDARNQLLYVFADIVNLVRPKVFVCENVKALASLTKWDSVRREFVKKTARHYSVGMALLDSKDFGVPQKRERVFFFGFHKDMLKKSKPEIEEIFNDQVSEYRMDAPSIRDIIEFLGPAGAEGNRRICNAKITYAKKPVLRRSPYAGMLFNGAGRPLDPNRQSSTLPASMGGNKTPIIDEGVIFHKADSFIETYHEHLLSGGKPYSGEAPKHLRRMTIDECLAVQTFPLDYQFSGEQSSIYKQIGNAVPCKLAEAVAKACISVVEKHSG